MFKQKKEKKDLALNNTDIQGWIYANDIVKNPEKIKEHPHKYCILVDTSMIVKGHGFDNLSKAIMMFGDKGWSCLSYEVIWAGSIAIGHALMEKPA